MNEQQNGTSVRGRVLASIENGRVFMRPKWQFLALSALVVLGAVVVVGAAIFLASFVLVVLERNGLWALSGFGPRGLRALLFHLPWLVIGTAALAVIVLEVLVRQFSFGYRRPILLTLAALVFMVTAGSFVLARTAFHPLLMRRAAEGGLPFVAPLYRGFGGTYTSVFSKRARRTGSCSGRMKGSPSPCSSRRVRACRSDLP